MDKNGRATKIKDFLSDLNLATGLAFGHGGVFVLQAPYLLFYPDRDGDDVPDGPPDVLLTGFGMEDASSVANSLTWAPTVGLYGRKDKQADTWFVGRIPDKASSKCGVRSTAHENSRSGVTTTARAAATDMPGRKCNEPARRVRRRRRLWDG